MSPTCRLERPIIANVSLEWAPQIHRFAPNVTKAGIESLTVAFPLTTYPGHLKVRTWADLSQQGHVEFQ